MNIMSILMTQVSVVLKLMMIICTVDAEAAYGGLQRTNFSTLKSTKGAKFPTLLNI